MVALLQNRETNIYAACTNNISLFSHFLKKAKRKYNKPNCIWNTPNWYNIQKFKREFLQLIDISLIIVKAYTLKIKLTLFAIIQLEPV